MNETRGSQLGRFLKRHDIADYQRLCDQAASDPEWFWRSVMEFHDLHFFKPYERLLDVTNGPEWAQWCIGGTTNIAYNCLNRTIATGRGNHAAIIWEGENGEQRTLTYDELASLTSRAAGGLMKLGCGRGDVVGLYMPMIPETIAAYLAIVGIGSIALPLFSGFGAQAIVERFADAKAKVVVTVDDTYRRGKKMSMLEVMDSAVPSLPALEHIIVVERHAESTIVEDARHISWRHFIDSATAMTPAELPAETPAMIVYTSGTTGKPKGTVHSHCGFMTKVALDFGLILDLQAQDRLLWMSDMGWLTGPILAVAVPLLGATLVLVEGVPDYPEPGRLWKLVEQHRVSFLGVAPTMVRAFMQQEPQTSGQYDLSSLRVTAATGEPWTPEAWAWFRHRIGHDTVPLLNYSGGTEIGGGILAGTVLHADVTPICAFAGAIPGMGARVVDDAGNPVAPGQLGELVLTIPSIGLTRGFWRDRQRYIESYWSRIPGLWVHGDVATVDQDGFWYVYGRSDDTIKISGKRTGPAEVEAALLGTGKVAEAAVIGIPDELKGSAIVCVCVLARAVQADDALINELKAAVATALGSSFRPKAVIFVADLPKTRTMKIMRRLVRSTLLGERAGDLAGLVNPEALDDLTRQSGLFQKQG